MGRCSVTTRPQQLVCRFETVTGRVEVLNTTEFEAWFMTLDEKATQAVIARVDLLAEEGPALRRPVIGEIKGSAFDPQMKELVCSSSLRVLFIFDPARQAVLLVGGDKAGNWKGWYRQAIPAADELYRVYLRETGQEA